MLLKMYICGQNLAPSIFNAMLEFYILGPFSERITDLRFNCAEEGTNYFSDDLNIFNTSTYSSKQNIW